MNSGAAFEITVMKIIEWVTHYQPFFAEVTEKVREDMVGRLIYEVGKETEVPDCEVTEPLDFEAADCSAQLAPFPFPVK